jgi:hypothetical protein
MGIDGPCNLSVVPRMKLSVRRPSDADEPYSVLCKAEGYRMTTTSRGQICVNGPHGCSISEVIVQLQRNQNQSCKWETYTPVQKHSSSCLPREQPKGR